LDLIQLIQHECVWDTPWTRGTMHMIHMIRHECVGDTPRSRGNVYMRTDIYGTYALLSPSVCVLPHHYPPQGACECSVYTVSFPVLASGFPSGISLCYITVPIILPFPLHRLTYSFAIPLPLVFPSERPLPTTLTSVRNGL
jgi:hypothetical protein